MTFFFSDILSYVYEAGELVLYFHGAKEGKKLGLLKKNPTVGIELDKAYGLATGKTACQYSYYLITTPPPGLYLAETQKQRQGN